MNVKKDQTEPVYEQLFTQLGLSDKEAIVYKVLLEQGKAPANQIITTSKLKRGITYFVLKSLTEKGLISSYEHNKKLYFQIEHPSRLLDLVKAKKEETQTLEHTLKFLLPKLTSQFKIAIDKPTVRYFEGEEGIKEVFEDIYGPKDEPVYGCVDLESGEDAVPDYIVKKLVPKRIKNKLMALTFFGNSPAAQKLQQNDTNSYRESFLLDKEEYPMPAEIDVYQDRVALLSFKKGEFLGLLIENEDFAQSLRSIFKLAHNLMKEKKKNVEK